MKLRIIKIVTFLGGIYFFVTFLLPTRILIGDASFEPGKYDSQMLKGVIVVGVMAIGLGMINLVRLHGYRTVRKAKNWIYSLALLLAMFGTIAVGLANWYFKEFQGGSETLHAIFEDFIFKGIYNNLSSAMFSLLAFYIAYAAYRSFRIQSLEAALMMAAAVVVMLGQIPLGVWISHNVPLVDVLGWRAWLMKKVNVPVFRGILFGSFLASLAMGVRMWLSLERTESRS